MEERSGAKNEEKSQIPPMNMHIKGEK